VRFLTKKKAAAAVGVVAILGGGLAAYAYFTSSGSANGSAGVGSATNWSVTGFNGSGSPSSSGTMYPGAGTATLTYRITNAGTGHQAVTSVTVAVATTTVSGNTVIVDNSTGTGVAGCLATWFTGGSSSFLASDGSTAVSLPADLAGSDYITGSTGVTMSNVASSQDTCQGHSPRVTVTVG
jgi:hypothetical protein